MHPYVYLFGLEIPVYGIISVIGLIAVVIAAIPLCKNRKVDALEMSYVGFTAVLGVLIGAHLLYAVTHTGQIISLFKEYSNYDSFMLFMKELMEYFSGMVFYGGLYGGLVAAYVWIRVRKLPVAPVADIFAVLIPLFHTFGRVGCFFAGCCYGIKCEWGIGGRVLSSGVTESIKRLPIQLIEAGVLLILFMAFLLMFLRNVARGKLLCLYLASYAVCRFILEFFRGDSIRGHLGWFSTSQWISVLTLVGVMIYLLVAHIKKKNKVNL